MKIQHEVCEGCQWHAHWRGKDSLTCLIQPMFVKIEDQEMVPEDCLMLMRAKLSEIDMNRLGARFNETASYDVSEDKVRKNLEHFKKLIAREGLAP